MTPKEYWKECLGMSLDEHGIVLLDSQIESIAEDIYNAFDCYNMAFQTPHGGQDEEANRLRLELQKERDKVTCSVCKGSGSITELGPDYAATSRCMKCNGEGRHLL